MKGYASPAKGSRIATIGAAIPWVNGAFLQQVAEHAHYLRRASNAPTQRTRHARYTSMKPIQMVDLVGQYQRIKAEVDQAMLNVVQSAAFINGPEVKSFEQELGAYLHVRHTIGCANGTDALQIAMMALDLKPGDEVITPSFTFVATVEVVALLGLKPVFAEVLPGTYNIDPADVRRKITPTHQGHRAGALVRPDRRHGAHHGHWPVSMTCTSSRTTARHRVATTPSRMAMVEA
jgi:hypothetical protein